MFNIFHSFIFRQQKLAKYTIAPENETKLEQKVRKIITLYFDFIYFYAYR